ncbi:MAG: winged helix-turn-helix domain-containing protein [Acidobacteriota bacterium]
MRNDFQLGEWIVQPSLNTFVRAAHTENGSGDPTHHRKVSHKVMAVLLCLAERPSEVVTKDELFAYAWEGTFTTDEALSTVVYELRKALDDDARNPRYIDTIRKGGYRLIAPISRASSPPASSPPEEPAPEEPAAAAASPGAEATTRSPDRRRVAFGALIAAALVVLALAAAWLRPGALAKKTEPARAVDEVAWDATRPMQSLAVLPFSTFTEECRQDFFADGLTEMLIADLAFLGPLDVLPGLVTRGLTAPHDLEQVATELAADAVLEGSVLRSGDRLWLSIQLVDARVGRILWGGTFEREIGDSLDLQQELSREIASQVAISVAPLIGREAPPVAIDVTPR